MIMSFGIHLLNDDISRFFLFFQKFDFPGCSVRLTLYLWNHTSYVCGFPYLRLN